MRVAWKGGISRKGFLIRLRVLGQVKSRNSGTYPTRTGLNNEDPK
jgi:hypothetical protein